MHVRGGGGGGGSERKGREEGGDALSSFLSYFGAPVCLPLRLCYAFTCEEYETRGIIMREREGEDEGKREG